MIYFFIGNDVLCFKTRNRVFLLSYKNTTILLKKRRRGSEIGYLFNFCRNFNQKCFDFLVWRWIGNEVIDFFSVINIFEVWLKFKTSLWKIAIILIGRIESKDSPKKNILGVFSLKYRFKLVYFDDLFCEHTLFFYYLN